MGNKRTPPKQATSQRMRKIHPGKTGKGVLSLKKMDAYLLFTRELDIPRIIPGGRTAQVLQFALEKRRRKRWELSNDLSHGLRFDTAGAELDTGTT